MSLISRSPYHGSRDFDVRLRRRALCDGLRESGKIFKKAHGISPQVFVGLLLVLLAWLIVDIVLSTLTGNGIAGWSAIECKDNPRVCRFATAPTAGGYHGYWRDGLWLHWRAMHEFQCCLQPFGTSGCRFFGMRKRKQCHASP